MRTTCRTLTLALLCALTGLARAPDVAAGEHEAHAPDAHRTEEPAEAESGPETVHAEPVGGDARGEDPEAEADVTALWAEIASLREELNEVRQQLARRK